MKVDINFLETISNFGKRKGLSRQHIYRLVESNRLNIIKIDGISFVLLDELAQNFERERKPKTPKNKNGE